ncbi:hypothetical protein GQ457_04G039510 [Hibiscus cannabinus]
MFQKTLQDVVMQLVLLADQVKQLNKTNDKINQLRKLVASRDSRSINDRYVFEQMSKPKENDIEDQTIQCGEGHGFQTDEWSTTIDAELARNRGISSTNQAKNHADTYKYKKMSHVEIFSGVMDIVNKEGNEGMVKGKTPVNFCRL